MCSARRCKPQRKVARAAQAHWPLLACSPTDGPALGLPHGAASMVREGTTLVAGLVRPTRGH
eukprot:137704-Alexandrium_andersonii.AAC.1